MSDPRIIKIFLASSITELEDERKDLGDYLMNTIRPIFKNDGIEIEVVKCEDIRSGNTGKDPQKEIDQLLRACDVSVFMFKSNAGDATIHEFGVARKLQKEKRHEIYVYCFKMQEADKSQSLKDFQDRLRQEKKPFYWKDCNDVNDLKSQFLPGLMKLERQLLHLPGDPVFGQETETEKDGDALVTAYQQNEQAHEQKQGPLREKIHQRIGELLQQTNTVMANEEGTIAERIIKVIELYQKADRWASKTEYDKEKYSDLLFDYADFLDDYGMYYDAEAVWLRQIPLAEELYGKEHEKTATSYNNIGGVYMEQGDYPKALEYYGKALAIYEKVLGKDHSFTATTYNNIGTVYDDQGNYPKALEYHGKALAIREEVLGKDHPDTASSYNNIGSVYWKQGDYPKALEYYGKALAIDEKVLGKDHPDTAATYNNIGTVYWNQGDYPKALEYYGKALAIVEKVLGKDHPDTASSYNNIGVVYDDQGDYPKALEYYGKALAIYEKILGKDHPYTASSYNNIGSMYYQQGKYREALEYLEKALKIRKARLGDDHPNTKATQEWIDATLAAMGKKTSFWQRLKRVLE